MNYELAKELKDARFPYESFFKAVKVDGTIVAGGVEEETDILVPTLSELIEACEPDFMSLTSFGEMEEGVIDYQATDWNKHEAHGKTPEEAVAKLWLALNK